jgi:uncharacterized membrane protein required for colicin V production
MTFFDVVVFALIAFSVVSGALRGFARMLISGAAMVVGLLVAARGYEAVGAVIHGLRIVRSKELANASGFLLIVIAAMVGGYFAGRLLAIGVRRMGLGWFDRILGGTLGLLSGLATCSVLYLALTAFPAQIDSVRRASTAPVLAWGARMLGIFTSDDVRTRFSENHSNVETVR